MSELMPREKLLQWGAEALDDSELLAIFLRTGIKNCSVMELSRKVIAHFGSLRQLICADQQHFCAVKGLGITQFIQLQACTEMTKRYLLQELEMAQAFTSPEIVRMYLQTELENKEREVFWVLFLDNQHRLIKKEEMFLGTINCAAVYPREIVKTALFCNAAAIILAHNHPSGIAEPSQADRNITEKIQQAAELMEVRVLDHFVIGKGCYVSFSEKGWL
ncbi:RadC family protein [Avibacterium paragallinarum]|uniref:MPN domain-containing protein n=1 Tax=Avibacterium paragallinarum TaxID=728 RepID=A0AAE5TIM4_AVIPA|nr:DNA repair protein RadC [Avibacterium paragallinarum]MEE3608769.1 DNA repair protein RadC [Avibacterium paragallinarum]MEE3620180.1 DNA repair protein RadC [Avibacterium paragallinarum]MEE3668137.1 DNA repair protein RadC [Avibacterium paragallinarum]MEE3681009.1 DNA repair protein RadC [Avibacterium paragallinarum]MEE4385846.1 DNA repair protein RadC [Avibacterium paragallinarum]